MSCAMAASTALSTITMYFMFKAPASSEIYTLSLHDALPIFSEVQETRVRPRFYVPRSSKCSSRAETLDRKSTRLNSSHQIISYAVCCLKKKKHQLDTHANSDDVALEQNGQRAQREQHSSEAH